MNHCDYGHATRDEVRLLPTDRGELHGNTIVCHAHYIHEMVYRRERVREGTWAETDTDFPKWNDLKIYEGE